MKTLLGIVASPRKYGNSELFVKELFRHLPEGWRLELVRLPAWNLLPCRACYRCLFDEMKCPQQDDFQALLEAMVAANALVVAAPTYFLGANSTLKRLLDRGLAFYAHLDRLWRKPAVGVAIAGIEGMEGYTKLMIDSFLKLVLADHRGSEVIYGALPGEIFLHPQGKAAAQRLAQALSGGHPEPGERSPATTALRCPLCGGDTFRFLDSGRVRCMLCSSEGTYRLDQGRLQVLSRPGKHPLFFTREDAREHLRWLRTMKDSFLEKRGPLKKITAGYRQIGTWLEPPSRSR